MSEGRIKTSRPISAFLLGLLATLGVALAHMAGLDKPLEQLSLDLRFRHFSSAAPNADIVRVDIDDRSLEELGRWPWPRERLAGIVDLLNDAGASIVALDVILPEPQETRYVSAATDVCSGDLAPLAGSAPPTPVFDDELLVEAIARRPDVFVPMVVDLSPGDTYVPRKLTEILATRPAVSAEEAADETGESLDRVSAELRLARLNRLEGSALAMMAQDPDISLEALLRQAMPKLPADARTEESELVRRAYLRRRSLLSLERFGLDASRLDGCPVATGRIVPPMAPFAEAFAGTGFVTFRPDDDGVLRRIPMLASGVRTGVFPQFALAIAMRRLADLHAQGCELSAGTAEVRLTCADDAAVSIPLDADGNMLIHWVGGDASASGVQISAAWVGGIHRMQQGIRRNRDLSQLLCLEMAQQLNQAELLELFAQADRAFQRRVAGEMARRRARLYDPAAAATQPADLQEPQELAEAKLADGCAKFRRELDEFYLRQPPADEAGREAYNRLARMRDQLDRIAVASEDSQKELSLLREKLRARISGKIVLVGSTATGAADFVHTPVGARTPGVEAHANILNTILSGAFITDSPPMAGVMAVLAAGALVSLIASTRRVTLAAVLTLALAAFYVTVNAEGVFHYGRMTLAMVAPLLAMLASFLVVTSFRQLTEERAKRQIRGMFSHALSPALVDELIAHPELARLGGQRRVLTCLFSDLAGFTPLTRRLGEQATVQLLRRYFDRMTALVQNRCGGYLNKFLGDGLFVLFGAPVQENDHARRALEAALLCQDAVADFNAELASELGGAVELSARAGVATGEVVVGNCGSSERFDYTAVGDEVNLASRLEGANKFFGTKLLAAESTWLASGLQEKVLARPMGKILLVGIDEPVSVWNPLAMRDALGADKRTAMEQACSQFARAVELFAARKFATAEELFLASGKIFCDDRACQVFAGLCRDYIAKAPAPDWNAAVRLTEK